MIDGPYIESLHFDPGRDLMVVVLNTKDILFKTLSEYSKLKCAGISQLGRYCLIGGGTGVHWPDLDEDLGLKGLLQNL